METLIIDVIEHRLQIISPSDVVFELMTALDLASKDKEIKSTLLNTYLLIQCKLISTPKSNANLLPIFIIHLCSSILPVEYRYNETPSTEIAIASLMAAFGTISEDGFNHQEDKILTLVDSLDNIDKVRMI